MNSGVIIIEMIVMLFPILFLCHRSNCINLGKSERQKQVAMPFIAAIYSLLACVFAGKIRQWIYSTVMAIPVLLYRLGQLIHMEGAFKGIAAGILAFLKAINWDLWLTYVIVFIVLLLFIELKRIALRIIKKLFSEDESKGSGLYETFYTINQQNGGMCLKEEFVDVRKFFKVAYYAGTAISCILMIVSSYLIFEGNSSGYFYPVYTIILLGEIYFFLNGMTKREYNSHFLGEDDDADSITNYVLLRNALRKIFPDKLLDEGTSINSTLAYDLSNEDALNKLEQNEDSVISTFAKFYKGKLKKGLDLDQNYMCSSMELLMGKSVLFNNPFYSDLIPYAFYPMNRKLLEHKKVLIVLGRHGIEDEIEDWIQQGVKSVTNIPYFWNIGTLTEEEFDGDIGILRRADVTNINIQEENAQFLQQVEFVVIIEPGKLITTAQIGLNMLIKKCRENEPEKDITFCMCDKNSDGLLDAMSHILLTSLEEVSATNKHKGTVSHMCWKVDEEHLQHRLVPNISKYLGVGTELSFAALKYQIKKARWYGGETFPVVDMNWISKQYYFDLMKYAGLPTSQELMDQKFITSANYWGAPIEKNSFITVEDEKFNIFEALRNFSTRTTSQGFVNIISPQYLLRDYMADNASIFETDAKAIPNIAADYAKTARNTTLGILLLLSMECVSENKIKKEFSLLGLEVYDLEKQLWFEIYKCFAGADAISGLPENYMEAVEAVSERKITVNGAVIGRDNITATSKYNYNTGTQESVYIINEEAFIQALIGDLKSASYVAEDEIELKNYLGSELLGQIYQKYLPGQFLTLGGKYYEMRYLTSGGEIIVRRAADHIDNRYTYRQIREYCISAIRKSNLIGDRKNIADMRVYREYADITVDTPGYYRMFQNNDLANAAKVLYEGEKTGIPKRVYKNKEILYLRLPQLDGLTEEVKYTLTLLLNETFKSLFAENQAYIVALCKTEERADKDPMTYSIEATSEDFDESGIYIVEDSQLDLGLLEAVERNLDRIFEIICDYLQWHTEALERSKNPDSEEIAPIEFTEFTGPEKKEKKGLLGRIKEFISSLFKRKSKKSQPASEPPTEQTVEEPEIEKPIEQTAEETENLLLSNTAESESTDDDEEDIIEFEEPKSLKKVGQIIPYHERYFTLYGFDAEPAKIATNAALEYLEKCGFGDNRLQQAREGRFIAQMIDSGESIGQAGARHCDFCGREISGVEFDVLVDGRERCMECTRTAIKTEKEFIDLYGEVKRNMESLFSIKINAGIKVQMVNAKKLHKRIKKSFVPTKASDARVLGVAIKDKDGFSLLIENGAPRMQSMLTIAHELTHIWQYVNWNPKQIQKKYGEKLELEIYEGMAKWSEIQYAYLINEPIVAKREEIITSYRNDEYGRGFLRYAANYRITEGSILTGASPFMNVEEPLALEFCGEILNPAITAARKEREKDDEKK